MSNALLGNVLRHTYTKEQGSNTLFRIDTTLYHYEP